MTGRFAPSPTSDLHLGNLRTAVVAALLARAAGVGFLVRIEDLNGDGILQLAELRLNTDVIVLATPEIAGLPYVVSGLVAAGGLAAALSTADGLLLTIANALSHDVYYKMIDQNATTTRRTCSETRQGGPPASTRPYARPHRRWIRPVPAAPTRASGSHCSLWPSWSLPRVA